MGIDYSFDLIFGYRVDESDLVAPFLKQETTIVEGKFHMEDRFDPKTGKKLEQVKVWDVKPNKKNHVWYEIGDDRYDDGLCDDDFVDKLREMFNCNIEQKGCLITGETYWILYLKQDKAKPNGSGRVTIYNDSLSWDEFKKLEGPTLKLKNKLAEHGVEVGNPEIMLTEFIC